MTMMSKTNVIEWMNPGLDDVSWTYPYEDLRWGSQAVVREYEAAIFMRDGKIYDVLPPGRHVITTANLPLLTRAYNFLAGLKETPFKVKVVYISLKQFRSRFGFTLRVPLSDKATWMTEVQSYGEYWFRITDPTVFLTQVIGAVQTFSAGDVSNFIRTFFMQRAIENMSKQNVMTIQTKLSEITATMRAYISEEFRNRGLELMNMQFAEVRFPYLEKMEKEDPTYGVVLLNAIQSGDAGKAEEIVKTVESMRALGKSSGAAFGAGLVAIPYVFGQQPQAPQPQAPVAQPQQPVPQAQKEDPADKLRKLKQMLDEGLISKEDYEQTKKKVLAEMS